MALTTMIGARIHRREDPRLVSGHGRYADDFIRPQTAFMAVVRSPFAHARITSIDAAAAKAAPGVVAVYTAADFEAVVAGAMPVAPAFVASVMSMLLIRACAKGLRTTDKKRVPGRVKSST